MTDEELHLTARNIAKRYEHQGLVNKLVRWNDIVQTAKDFYPNALVAGLEECVLSCVMGSVMYDNKNTLAVSLNKNYRWMLS